MLPSMSARPRRGWISVLPWVVAVGALVALLPFGIVAWVEPRFGLGVLLEHTPVFFLLSALAFWTRARAHAGESVRAVVPAAIVGACVVSVSLLLGVLVLALRAPPMVLLYQYTALLLLGLAPVGGAIGAAIGWLSETFRSEPAH